jgi:hypothetical protein
MMLFNRKKESLATREDLEKKISVEIKQHEKITKKTVAETKKVADNFNRVIRNNGFTLQIHVAAGGKR